jgi:hypothetical protein
MISKQIAIVEYRNKVGDRIDRRFGAFTAKANLLHEENQKRMKDELKKKNED